MLCIKQSFLLKNVKTVKQKVQFLITKLNVKELLLNSTFSFKSYSSLVPKAKIL